ncbi:MAG: histone deacetylase superfamily [Frankiales bacterium]|nr:histone deacetylase superfamily [Frankiales bacterium]
MSHLLLVRQRRGHGDDAAPWIIDSGRRIPGQDHDGRLDAILAGLATHAGVDIIDAAVGDAQVDRVVEQLHDADYLAALWRLAVEPVLMPDFTAPGMEADIPAGAGLAAAAREAVRTAIASAHAVVAGARFAYALCRPPGHHAGPAWCGGYCYLNTAAAAAQTLRAAGAGPVGILDLDLHYPNGTSAIVAGMADVELHSLHAWPVTNSPTNSVLPRTDRERMVEFRTRPDVESYLDAVDESLDALSHSVRVLVLSLGYDTVAGDPHGSWSLAPETFTEIGRLLAASGLPVCVVQEGGYALDLLADCSRAFATGLLAEVPVA